MPHMDGEETCRELRRIRKDVPVIHGQRLQ